MVVDCGHDRQGRHGYPADGRHAGIDARPPHLNGTAVAPDTQHLNDN